jgi:hypothetical protein
MMTGRILCALLLVSLGCGAKDTKKEEPIKTTVATTKDPKQEAPKEEPKKEEPPPALPKKEEPKEEPAATEKAFTQLDAEDTETIVELELKPKEKLAHPIFEGMFGPDFETTFVLYEGESPEAEERRLQGFVLVPRAKVDERINLPDLATPDEENQALDKVSAVFFDNLDADPAREPIVIASCWGLQNRNFPCNVALDWNGSKFVRLKAIEKKIENATTAQEAREALKK